MLVVWAWRDGSVTYKHLVPFQKTQVQVQTHIRALHSSATPARGDSTPLTSPQAHMHVHTPPPNKNKSVRISHNCLGLVYKCAFSLQAKLAVLITLFTCECSIVLQYDLIDTPGPSGEQSAASKPEFRRPSATAPHQ